MWKEREEREKNMMRKENLDNKEIKNFWSELQRKRRRKNKKT